MTSRAVDFFRCERGNALILATAVIPMLVGAGAVGIDVAGWALAKRQLQRSADSAALAGAIALQWPRPAKEAAERDLQLNNQVPFSSTPVIENAPTVGPYKGQMKAVRVQLQTAPRLTFVSYFMPGTTAINAEATAAVVPDPRFCMVALENSMTTPGVTFDGSTAMSLDCGVGANSQASPAIDAQGASSVNATTVAAIGSVPRTANYSSGTEVLSYQPPIVDPYAGLPAASSYATKCTGATALVVDGNKKANVKPGCFAGMTLKVEVNFGPGTYVINDASMVVESGAILTGENVTFILTGSDPTKIGTVTINGGANLSLSPNSSNKELLGILFYQDSRAPSGLNSFSGNSTSKLSGSLYFPKQTVKFTGNSGMNTNCLRIVARTLAFTGNGSVTSNCSGAPGSGLFGERARLVG